MTNLEFQAVLYGQAAILLVVIAVVAFVGQLKEWWGDMGEGHAIAAFALALALITFAMWASKYDDLLPKDSRTPPECQCGKV